MNRNPKHTFALLALAAVLGCGTGVTSIDYVVGGRTGNLPEGVTDCGSPQYNPNWEKCVSRSNLISRLVSSVIDECVQAAWGAYNTEEVFYLTTDSIVVDPTSGDSTIQLGLFASYYNPNTHHHDSPANQVAYYPRTYADGVEAEVVFHEGFHAHQAKTQDSAYYRNHTDDNEIDAYGWGSYCAANIPGPAIREFTNEGRPGMFRLTAPALLMVAQLQVPTISPSIFAVALTGLMASTGDDGKVGQSAEPVYIDLASFKRASRTEKDSTLDWSRLTTALGNRGSTTRTTSCVTCPTVTAGAITVEGEKLIVHLNLTRRYGVDQLGRTRVSGTEYLVVLVKASGDYRFSGISGMVTSDGVVIPGRGGGG